MGGICYGAVLEGTVPWNSGDSSPLRGCRRGRPVDMARPGTAGASSAVRIVWRAAAPSRLSKRCAFGHMPTGLDGYVRWRSRGFRRMADRRHRAPAFSDL